MATGPETVYPIRHTDFAENLCHIPGCALVTDYPPGTAPLAIHFLRRNRIIAGLSEATVLIESKIRGGGMMTANLASSYGRDVYAVPGRIDDLCSQGCNYLIGSKIAESITGEKEFIRSLGMTSARSTRRITEKEQISALYGNGLPADKIEQLTKDEYVAYPIAYPNYVFVTTADVEGTDTITRTPVFEDFTQLSIAK
jgi:DNA processing protein